MIFITTVSTVYNYPVQYGIKIIGGGLVYGGQD